MVSVVLDNLAAGVKRKEIIASYPGLADADLDAALAYAAELAREGTVALPLEIGARLSRSTKIVEDPSASQWPSPSKRSASIAAMQPAPAAVIAWR